MAIIVGCYAAMILLHLAIGKNVSNDTPVILTSAYSTFLVWVGLMIMVYLIKKAWISWAILVGISALSALFIFV